MKFGAEPAALSQGPCQESNWKYTFCTGGAKGLNELLVVKLNWLPVAGVIVVVSGIGWTCCSVSTVTLALLLLAA